MYSVNLIKILSNTRRKRLRLRPVSLREAYGLEALRERSYPSKFDSAAIDRLRSEHVEGNSLQGVVQYSAVRSFLIK